MAWSFNVGSIAGTAVRIHVTFLLLLAWIGFSAFQSGGSQAAVSGVAFMILLFACVLAHEFGHIFMARRFGIPTPDVTLLPIGGVATLERMPEKPREQLLVAIAGPAVNVVIAAVLMAWLALERQPGRSRGGHEQGRGPQRQPSRAPCRRQHRARRLQPGTGVSDGRRPRAQRAARHAHGQAPRASRFPRASAR